MHARRQVSIFHVALMSTVAAMALLSARPSRAAPANAEVLTALHAKLAALHAPVTADATLDIHTTTLNKKAHGGKPSQARARIGIQMGADGLAIHVAPALLAAAAAELKAQAVNADTPTPVVDLLGNAGNPVRVARLLQMAPALLNDTATAQVTGVKASNFHGTPAQELSLSVPQPKSTGGIGDFKDFSDVLTIWLGADGVPLGYQGDTRFQVCKLFLCMHFTQSVATTLKLVNGCLLAATRSTEQKTSGLGQDSDTRTTYALQVQSASCTR